MGGYQKSGVGRPTQSLFPTKGSQACGVPAAITGGGAALWVGGGATLAGGGGGPALAGKQPLPSPCPTVTSLCPPGLGLALRPSCPPLGLTRGPVRALPFLLPDPLTPDPLSTPSLFSLPAPSSGLLPLAASSLCSLYVLVPTVSKMSFAARCPNQIPVQQQAPRTVTTSSILFDLRELFFRTLPSSN